jgi:predicted HTH transcriptional regulator
MPLLGGQGVWHSARFGDRKCWQDEVVGQKDEGLGGFGVLAADAAQRCLEALEDALREIVTNAVLHRDYSIAADVQIQIFDDRIEIESPGKSPGHVTVKNVLEVQFAGNPKLVRLANKFPNAPNKEVGEGLNTAFEAMEKLPLKDPTIEERDNSIVVTLRHESLASPETSLALAELDAIVVFRSYNKTSRHQHHRILRAVSWLPRLFPMSL